MQLIIRETQQQFESQHTEDILQNMRKGLKAMFSQVKDKDMMPFVEEVMSNWYAVSERETWDSIIKEIENIEEQSRKIWETGQYMVDFMPPEKFNEWKNQQHPTTS